MVTTKILYNVARSEAGELVLAKDAEKGRSFFCGFCKFPLVLKKSGKTGPRTKRPHFAHKVLTPNCTPESALHFEFKTMLAEEISRRINERVELTLSWTCEYCSSVHPGNLIKKARRVAIEYPVDGFRPDIVLFDENDRVLAVVEVVVTHPPEAAARDHYRLNKIALVELRLDSDEVLNDIPSKLLSADHVPLCTAWESCTACGHYQQPVEMKIFEVPCYGCRSKMKIPFIEGDDVRGSHVGSDHFTQFEISIARKHGAVIEKHYSRTLNCRYMAPTCSRCKCFVGSNYLFTHYIVPAFENGSSFTSVRLGNFCSYCESKKHSET